MLKYLLIGFGALVVFLNFAAGMSVLDIWSLLGVAIMLAAWRLIPTARGGVNAGRTPPVPPGFTPSFWNKNIALDATTRALWIRDRDGATATLQPEDVVGWEMQHTSFSSGALVGPRVTPLENRLLIKTRDLRKPVWTVPFDAHSTLTGAGNHANHQELKAWHERLNVVYNHAPAASSGV